MGDHVNNVEPSTLHMEQDVLSTEQNINILQEIKDLNEKLKNPNYKTYKKSTYWHQQAVTSEEENQNTVQKEIMECLLRIEAKLAKIETLLEK